MRPESTSWLNNTNIADFVTREQHEALLNNDEDSLRKADDRALAEAILASLEDESMANRESPATPDRSDTDSLPPEITEIQEQPTEQDTTATTLSQAHYDASRKINQQLAGWFRDHGFQVVRNSGKDANCLLISMAQHAAGHYESEHSAEVQSLREKVKEYTTKHHPKDASINDYSLYSDGKLMEQLVKEINARIIDPQKKLSFWIATADSEGQPGWRKVGDGPKKAIIFDQGGHYEAVIPREITTTR